MKTSFLQGKTIRRISLLIIDILVILVSEFLSLLIRFEFRFDSISPEYLHTMGVYTPVNIGVTILLFIIFQLYSSLWAYASVQEMICVIGACVASTALQIGGIWAMGMEIPRSYHVLYFLILTPSVVCSRFCYRFLRMLRMRMQFHAKEDAIPTMVIGAGEAGNTIIREIINSRKVEQERDVVCVIDDDPAKIGTRIRGIPVIGGRECIVDAVEKYHVKSIIFAIPTLPSKEKKEILQICNETDATLLTLPGIYQLINGEVSVSMLRKVKIEDLLGREPVNVNLDDILNYVKDQVVMVTGGGGSIGSELCRQIASHKPKQLIILDIYENNAYEIQQELLWKYPDLDLVVHICSVRNTHWVNTLFERYKPNLVFHAAAHKHVPLMENSPNEAIKNNVFGTLNVARAADANGASKFVLISTDKAVNPTNIMGASKRICEMIIQGMARHSKTEFAAVRFGNVLGSNGSVIPLFKKQIENGGPVTVTDERIIRYFMTIPEAVSLVLQAGAIDIWCESFLLEIGEPVKIVVLSKNLIRLSGLKLGVDIDIEFTGLRPGEKLFEETLMDEEGLRETENKLIHIGKPLQFDEKKFFQDLVILKELAYRDTDEARAMVMKLVPTYHPSSNLKKNVV